MHELNQSEFLDGFSNIILNADRPEAFLASICEFTKADAGSLWSNIDTSLSPDIFFLSSVYNRPNAEGFIADDVHFDINEDNVVASKALSDGKCIVGTVGTSPFDSSWMKKDYTKDLIEIGIKTIAIIPVYDFTGSPFSVLSLYFRSQDKLNPKDFYNIGELLSSTNEAFDKRLRTLRLERRKDRHEVMAHTRIISSKLVMINREIKANKDSFVNYTTVRRRFNDAIRSLSVMRTSYKSASFKERVIDRCEHSQYIRLNFFMRGVLASNIRTDQASNTVVAGDVIGARKLRILFNLEDLTMLFSNIYSNAIKYSIHGSVIRSDISKNLNGVRVEIRNDIAVEIEDDLSKIWNYEQRGDEAIARDIPGEGIGLGLVQDICDVYDIHFEAQYEIDAKKKHTKVFCVSLEIPNAILD